ncbi:hypothetical protein ACHAXA_006556 [Cyclostephanos tholiformis]|uniref:Uncharacterized protein n=1 Tax=Cyclostephanos tholiformis TaxID=382380 RepID=A0ABD3R6N7_9STRA
MCPPTESLPAPIKVLQPKHKFLIGALSLSTISFLVATIVLAATNKSNSSSEASNAASSAAAVSASVDFLTSKASSNFFATSDEDNFCAGAKLAFDNKLCADLEVPTPQAGANVTKGYVGDLDVGDLVPNTKPYWQSSMCPVNVHWHLGSEHYSVGQYDETGNGPNGNIPRPEWANRDLSGTDSNATEGENQVQDGFRCLHYDPNDAKFTTPYNWQHCEGMEVGETYEVHWPHSTAGAYPFYDGVFCNLTLETFSTLGAQDIANAVGVHGQVFTIVNDESYFYPDMIRGMIVDKEMGKDIHIYTGSTTGDKVSNEMCSLYAPITWQVDRKCHMISASSFDKMCYDMKMQRDDMSDDLHAHGSRELVNDDLAANNQYYPGSVRRNLRS